MNQRTSGLKRASPVRGPKKKRLEILMTRAELELCEFIAKREGYSTATWAREAVLKHARRMLDAEQLRDSVRGAGKGQS